MPERVRVAVTPAPHEREAVTEDGLLLHAGEATCIMLEHGSLRVAYVPAEWEEYVRVA